MDCVPANKSEPKAAFMEAVRKSISALNVTFTDPMSKARESHSFTNGMKHPNETPQQDANEKEVEKSEENVIKDTRVFYMWTKQINSCEPFMVFEEMLTFQGKRYSETEIAPIWKKDCRTWLWKTKSKKIARKVRRNTSEEIKDLVDLFRKLKLKKYRPTKKKNTWGRKSKFLKYQ